MKGKGEEAGLGKGRSFNADMTKIRANIECQGCAMLDQNDQTFIPLLGSAPTQAVLGRMYLQTRHLCAAKVVPERADSWRMSTDQTRQW